MEDGATRQRPQGTRDKGRRGTGSRKATVATVWVSRGLGQPVSERGRPKPCAPFWATVNHPEAPAATEGGPKSPRQPFPPPLPRSHSLSLRTTSLDPSPSNPSPSPSVLPRPLPLPPVLYSPFLCHPSSSPLSLVLPSPAPTPASLLLRPPVLFPPCSSFLPSPLFPSLLLQPLPLVWFLSLRRPVHVSCCGCGASLRLLF